MRGWQIAVITEDSSMEFDLYEDARRRLTNFLVDDGYDGLEAERIALYVIQGVRVVPKLLSILNERKHSSPEHLRAALHAVLDNASALDKARTMLTVISDEPLLKEPGVNL